MVKNPTLLNFFHAYKLIGIILVLTIICLIVLLFFKIKKFRMPKLLAKFIRFFIFKIFQVILIESFFFLLINSVSELTSTISNKGYTFVAIFVILVLSTYFIMLPFHFLLTTLWLKTPIKKLPYSIFGSFYDDLKLTRSLALFYYLIFMV